MSTVIENKSVVVSVPNGNESNVNNAADDDREDIHIPLYLKFENLVVKSGEKTILNDISGQFLPGELVAIMGPSGAGKSTLLNFLAGRAKGMDLQNGQILINGCKATKTLRRNIGYVLQEDVFFSHLTVNQTLNFVGDVTLPERLTKSQKRHIVQDVIKELGLTECADTVMGGGMFITGCSGGEKKRCSIATELITNPSMLMMDEPTSGLDSSTAFNLISTLKTLTQTQNHTIVTTIHQPSSRVFHMFDKLLLVAGGKVAYFGRTIEVLKFFEFLGKPCYENWNPADFIMEQLSGDSELVNTIAEKFIAFKKFKEVPIVAQSFLYEHDDVEDKVQEKFDEKTMERWPTGYKTQVTALSKRAFIQFTKNMLDRMAFLQTFCLALVCGSVWLNTPYTEDSLSDRRGVGIADRRGIKKFDVENLKLEAEHLKVFFLIEYIAINSMLAAVTTFPAERDTVAKERAAGMYRLSAYYSAKLISEVPALLLQPFLLHAFVYWMAGLNRSPMYLVSVLTMATCAFLSQSIGYVIGCMIKDFKGSMTCAILFALTTLLLGGFYTQHIPPWLTWSKYLSPISYGYNVLTRIEFEYAVHDFSCSIQSSFKACENRTSLTGNEVLEKFKIINLSIGETFVVLWAWIIFYQALFYIALRFRNKTT